MEATSPQTDILGLPCSVKKNSKKNSLSQNHHAGAVLRLPGADALGRPLATTF